MSNGDFSIWKENAALLYDHVGLTRLVTPSVTLNWLNRTVPDPEDDRFIRQGVVVGTCYKSAKQRDKNRLKFMSVPIPLPPSDKNVVDRSPEELLAARKWQRRPDETSCYEGFDLLGRASDNMDLGFKTEQLVEHSAGEVNRARVNLSETIVATSSIDGVVRLFSFDGEGIKVNQEPVNLKGHAGESWALCWNSEDESKLVSCGTDGAALIWDVEKPREVAFRVTSFTSPPTDARWTGKSTFVVADDGGTISWFDIRCGFIPVIKTSPCGRSALNAVAASAVLSNIVVTGGDARQLVVLDSRRPDSLYHRIKHHDSSIQEIDFHPDLGNVLATCDNGHDALVWNIGWIGREVEIAEEDEAPAELAFHHSGHQGSITDIRWNPRGSEFGHPLTLGSVGEDYCCQVWSIREDVVLKCDEDRSSEDLLVKLKAGIDEPMWFGLE